MNWFATVQASARLSWPHRIARSRVVVDEVVVIDIRNVRDIGDVRVGDVHLIEVTAAHAIPWDKRLAKSQRAPAIASAVTEPEAHAPARPAKESHERGRLAVAYEDRSTPPPPALLVD